MLTLGIDPALTATGLCLVRDGEPLEWLTLRTNAKDDLDRRIAGLAKQVAAQLAGHRPEVCAIEEPYVATWERGAKGMGQAADAMNLARLATALAVEATKAGALVVMIPPQEGFRALTGSPKGDKAGHVRMANARRGRLARLEEGDHHLADAFGVALAGEARARHGARVAGEDGAE